MFLEFEHLQNPDINIEHVRTYEANMRRTKCSVSGPQQRDEQYVANPGSAMMISTGEIGQYTHRPCDMGVKTAALFKYTDFRGIRASGVSPTTRVGRIFMQADFPTLVGLAIGDNQVNSLMVPAFTDVILYEGPSWSGESLTVRRNIGNLSQYRLRNGNGPPWSGAVSSARIRENYAPIIAANWMLH